MGRVWARMATSLAVMLSLGRLLVHGKVSPSFFVNSIVTRKGSESSWSGAARALSLLVVAQNVSRLNMTRPANSVHMFGTSIDAAASPDHDDVQISGQIPPNKQEIDNDLIFEPKVLVEPTIEATPAEEDLLLDSSSREGIKIGTDLTPDEADPSNTTPAHLNTTSTSDLSPSLAPSDDQRVLYDQDLSNREEIDIAEATIEAAPVEGCSPSLLSRGEDDTDILPSDETVSSKTTPVHKNTTDVPNPPSSQTSDGTLLDYLSQEDYHSRLRSRDIPIYSCASYEEYCCIHEMVTRYRGRLLYCSSHLFPNCDIFLCGTLHVAKSSTEMVREAVSTLAPRIVVVEVCESRIDNLVEGDLNDQLNVTLKEVLQHSWAERSVKQLGMGLLSWMQTKAAKGMGSKLGGELAAAAKEAARLRSLIVLGDRAYAVTIQRVFDRLGFLEKLKMGCILIWEVISMSVNKLKEYIKKSEDDDNFVKKVVSPLNERIRHKIQYV